MRSNAPAPHSSMIPDRHINKQDMTLPITKKTKPLFKRSVFTILGIIFAVYFISVSIHSSRIDAFNTVMILMGLWWIMISIKINKIYGMLKRLPRFIKIGMRLCLLFFAFSFIIIESVIIYNMRTTPPFEADYVMVLGCQVNGSIPSIPLLRRVTMAISYLKENKSTHAVVTGGKGPGENISEAEAMKRILIRHGIDEKRIFEENQSKSTMENFKYAHELYGLLDKNIVVVSSDYHIYRALSMAKKLQYKNIHGLPSRSQFSVLPAYLLREYAAVVYYLLLGRI